MTNAHLRELDKHLDNWLIRLRLRDAFIWSPRGLMAGLAIGLGFSVVARLRPLLPVPTLVLLSFSAAIGGFALALALAHFLPPPPPVAARHLFPPFRLAARTS